MQETVVKNYQYQKQNKGFFFSNKQIKNNYTTKPTKDTLYIIIVVFEKILLYKISLFVYFESVYINTLVWG